jgi:hypothetical protein
MINNLKNLARRNVLNHLQSTLLFICLLSFSPVSGQNDTVRVKEKERDTPKRYVSLFSNDEIINVSIYIDLAAYLKKQAKTNTFDAEMTIHFSETDTIKRSIVIKYRGISRYEICTFPPMQINFKKPIYSDSMKIKKLKLVTHCDPGGITDEYVIREYLVYKLFNALTDTSFRARLLKVNYIDSKGNKKTISKYGIFIEPVELLAKRTNSTVVKTEALGQKHIIPYVMDRLSIFNYMITCWDWSITGQHNVAVIKSMGNSASELGIAIPYDFDLTGVVNADYAIPPPDLGIETIREPYFRGACRTREVYREDLKVFSDSKDKLYAVVNEFPHLNPRSKKDITYFLDQFFNQLEKQRSIDNLIDVFLKNCKN